MDFIQDDQTGFSFYRTMHVHCICIVWCMLQCDDCLSRNSTVLKQLNGSNWFSARRLPSYYPTLCCKGIWVSPKIGVLYFGTLTQSLIFSAFSPWNIDCCKCFQLSLTPQVCHAHHPTLFTTHWLWDRTLHRSPVTADFFCLFVFFLFWFLLF